MEYIELVILRGKIDALERLAMAGFDAGQVRSQAKELLQKPDIPAEEKSRLDALAQTGLGSRLIS